ncbi:MAG TPA: chemotaxis protein CheA, partial [Gemmatimonadales bacterium]|nr:chemotaxis protein CheA [Gemmatimonadales bacterium]
MDLSKYAALFLAESREHLSSCNQLLLKWEREPAATEPVGGLFRSIHTIKGMGATMGFTGVAELAHRLESLLDALRHGRVVPDAGTFELLFRAVDALGSAVESAAEGRETAPDPALVAALDRATNPGREAPAAAGPLAAELDGPHRRRATDARGRSVQVLIRPDAVMRGARAVLAVRRAEALGVVTAVRPPLVQLEREEFDGRLAFRVDSAATDEELAAVIRTAGEVEAVRFEEPAAEGSGLGRQRQIRVDLNRLDRLMKQVGELVVAKNRLGVMAAHSDDPALVELTDRISRLVSGMQAEVIASRMTPVGEVFERFPRLVRDLARDLGKRIRFDMEGEEIELDRSILDEIGDPLLHLIRNAADHGIEAPEVRAAAGKPEEGRILLAAARERNSVVLRVSDDGRGMDRAAILAKARREDAVGGADGEALTDDALLRVIARPGFSTAQAVSGVSGRGVGVDVAMTRVRQLGGTLEVRSEAGKGTSFQIRVPLTLAIVRALLADAGGERYAVPLAYVAETVDFDPRAVTALRAREALVVREQVIPTVHLRDLVASRERPTPPR